MPGAGRTREPCVQRRCTLRTQATTGQPNQPAFPAQWFTAYTRSPRGTGLVSPRRLPIITGRLDASVGASGPRDFAVRRGDARLAHHHVHRIPGPTSVTIAIRPSCGPGTRGDNHNFPKNGSKIFLTRRLDIASDKAKRREPICPSGRRSPRERNDTRVDSRMSLRSSGLHAFC